MDSRIYNWLTEEFPQNYLIKHPVQGALISAIFDFIFIWLYQPLHFHGSDLLSFNQLMGAYSLAGGLSMFIFVKLLKSVRYFSLKPEWTIIKEIAAILIVLCGIGIGIFLIAFIIDPETAAWSFSSLLNSLKIVYLIGSIPFLFFLVMNLTFKIRHRSVPDNNLPRAEDPFPSEEEIQIKSQLKKETLEFFPSQLLYAESDGNYVVFHLQKEDKAEKKIIRNSISQVEKQLINQPLCVRTHRSFIVNLRKVTRKQGNASGYRLTLEGISNEVPVSRQHIKKFDQILENHELHPA